MNPKEWKLGWVGGGPLLVHTDTLLDDDLFINLLATIHQAGRVLVKA